MDAQAKEAVRAVEALLPQGSVLTDAADMAPYLTDWRGQKHGTAQAVVRPSTVDEVAALVRLAATQRYALVPQGGNTGLVGASVPEPVTERPTFLVSTIRMDRVRSVDPESLSMVAEAGVILDTVHVAADGAGVRFPLSLGARGSATVGGLVSTNAGGVQVLRHGAMRQLVLGLEAVLPDGTRLDQLAPLRKDNTGYDIKQLLIGAEGTLGIVTAVSLKLAPRMRQRSVAWAGLSGVGDAVRLLGRLRAALGEVVESFEIIGAEALALVTASGLQSPLHSDWPACALIEAEVPTAALEQLLSTLLEDGLIGDATLAASLGQAASLWHLREMVPEAEKREGPAVKNDISVPVAEIAAFIEAADRMLADRFKGIRPIWFGHLGDGNLHYNLRAPLGEDAPTWLMAEGEKARVALHDLVLEHGGSISAEHGIGTLKKSELARLGNPGKLQAMRAIKAALDPFFIMNPGKLIG